MSDSQPPKKRGRPPGKRSDPAYYQVGALIKMKTYKAVQKRLIDEDKDFSELVQELLEQWLADKSN